MVVNKFDWRLFRRHFVYYAIFLTLQVVVRDLTKGSFNAWAILAAPVVFSPIAAGGAFLAMRQKPYIEGDPIPKPRIWKSIAIGFGICAVVVLIASAARE